MCSSDLSTAFKMSALCDPGNKRSPAVALTATGVHPCRALGTTRTASSKRTSRLRAAPSGLPANEDRPGCVILNTSYSYSGEGPQLLNLYTWILEPVEPASIISAYCTSVPDEEWGWVQNVVDEGLDQFRMSLGGWWLALEQGRADCVVVVGVVGVAFWKERALCPFCILFP